MNKIKVCAGIVLYNPELDKLRKNIESIISQVSELFLFDNASDNAEEIKKLIERFPKTTYYYHEKNEGIAYGLNCILKYADKNNYKWFLTLDQDSICSQNLIEEYAKYIDRKKCALICPYILNNGKISLHDYYNLKLPDHEIIHHPIDCITSACLGNVEIVKKLGGYPTEYFIDYVDTDLNCRVLLAGYEIIKVNHAFLIQSMGEGRKIQIFDTLYKWTKLDLFRRMRVASVYGDLRLYYAARNSIVVHKKYKNAGFRTSLLYMIMLYIYFTFTYPPERSRRNMWRCIISGIRDSNKMK